MTADPMDALTPSERRVAGILAGGATNREIARQLFISEDTVKSHVKAILRKLEVPDRTAAAIRIRETGDREAATTLIQIAADHYRGSRLACARILFTARSHHMPVEELVHLSGLSHAQVSELLKEAT